MITLSNGKELGTKIVRLDFTKAVSGDPVSPDTLMWTLLDGVGNIVNSQEQVEVAVPESTVYIVLAGDDLASGLTDSSRKRRLVIEATYTETIGGTEFTELPIHEAAEFDIEELPYIGEAAAV